MAMTIDSHVRAEVLAFASAFTSDKSSAAAVTANAVPLLAWLEESLDEADAWLRCRALRRHHLNTRDERPDDEPHKFVSQARVLYAFLTAHPSEDA